MSPTTMESWIQLLRGPVFWAGLTFLILGLGNSLVGIDLGR